MSKDSQPAICLEVIVPRIISPILSSTPSAQHANAAEPPADVQAGEALGLSTLKSGKLPHPTRRQPDQETIEQTATSHTKYRMHFRLFRLPALPVSQPLFLRILHRARKPRSASEQYLASDTCPLHLAFVPATSSAPASPSMPGPLMSQATHIEIVLDEEGVPSGYRIDGAEG